MGEHDAGPEPSGPPRTLDEAILEAGEAGGADEAVVRFAALRERFYGAAAYDLTPGSVNEVASQLEEHGDTPAALRFFERALELAPGNARIRRKLDGIG